MKFKRRSTYLIFQLSILVFFSCVQQKANNSISLAGKWQFQADPADQGIEEKWYSKPLKETVRLPGSMRDNGKGDELSLQTAWTGSIYDSSWFFDPRMEKYRQLGNLKFPFWLTPNKHHVGPAWYQRTIQIPESWTDKRITLYLERPHWETAIWIDDTPIGMYNSLSVPHEYNLTSRLTPGKHRLTIRVDNRIKDINPGPDSHSLTDHTQGNWNGIVGEIKLNAGSPVYVKNVQLYPDIDNKSVNVQIHIRNESKESVTCTIELTAQLLNEINNKKLKTMSTTLMITKEEVTIPINYPMGEELHLWDEFNPNLYSMEIDLSDTDEHYETRHVQFGMREFKAQGTRFEINGRPTFLRGTVESCVFPETGYPPTDVNSWKRVFQICHDHGLNHMRFHSWCPPEAAFTAADQVGFYLQPESASWANHGTSIGNGLPIDQYIYEETQRILDAYGNHPSFCMMAYGNEPAGRNQVKYLGEYVNHFKAKDNRRLYTSASIGKSWPLVPESEFIVRSGPRGLPWGKRPQSQFDYREKIKDADAPYIAHEVGQYCVYPNFNEIDKYDGVYRAKNFELFQETLQDHHMGNLANQFVMASGKLQALCYKAEIEAALRTQGFAGTQLLSLNDFPGQGSAIVGILDAFWDEKPYINASEFRRFFGPTVPLARLAKFVFHNDEIFHADLEMAHFGKNPIKNIAPIWKILNSNTVFAQGILDTLDVPIGNCISLGNIDISLLSVTQATKMNLSVTVGSFENDWEFWVYPSELHVPEQKEIYYCDHMDEKAEQILSEGGKVFLQAAGKVENGKEVIQYFRPVFWNTSWFKMRPPHTLGILCDPNHPAFHDFPTEYHSNLQWWEILHRQQMMNLENFPDDFRPLIQLIDTWFLNRRLGMLFEAKVGQGKILVCSADIDSDLENRPAARQLKYSLMTYVHSNQFEPEFNIDISIIKELFEKKIRTSIDFYTKGSTDDLKPVL